MKLFIPSKSYIINAYQEGSRNLFFSFFPSVLSAITIVVLSAIPGDALHLPEIWNIDKYIHLAIYFVQTIVMMIGFRLYFGKEYPKLATSLLPFVLSVSMGGSLELLQEFVFIHRSGDWLDFLANTLGAFAGVIIGPLVLRTGTQAD